MLQLECLPKPQQDLWPLLSQVPGHFVLYGGTAIALRLNHRISVDFDFFSAISFDPLNLHRNIPFLKNAELIQTSPETLTCLAGTKKNPVKISFFGGLMLGQIEYPELIKGPNIKIASLIDLFGMKCATITARIEQKDYLDIDAIITTTSYTLSDGIAAAKSLYQNQYSPILTLKALSCFEGGDLEDLAIPIRKRLMSAVTAFNANQLPDIHAIGSIGDTNA